MPAQIVAFDSHNDIAVLRVPGLDRRPLPLAGSTPSGRLAAIMGYPGDGPFNAQPARLGSTAPVRTEDAFGDGPIVRTIVSLRGLVRPGNSGGPVVDAGGAVDATVFAAITGGPGNGGFAVPDSVVRSDLAVAERARHSIVVNRCAA
jgi:S1-C subfamily serine protease